MRSRFFVAALVLSAVAAHAQQGTPAGSHIVVTPAVQTLQAGDTLRLHAQLVDAAGKVVPVQRSSSVPRVRRSREPSTPLDS